MLFYFLFTLIICLSSATLISFPAALQTLPHCPSVLRGAIIPLNNSLVLPVSQQLTAFVLWEGPVKYLQKTKCTYMNLNDTVSANYLSPHIWINRLDLIQIQTKGTSLTIQLDDEITDALYGDDVVSVLLRPSPLIESSRCALDGLHTVQVKY